MTLALTTLTVDLNVSLAKFESDLKQAVNTSKKSADEISGAFESLRHTLEAIGVGLGLKEFIGEAVTANIEFERSQNRLAAALKATGYAAGLTKDELNEMADALAKSTAFSPTDIREAEVTLLRFRDIHNDVYKRALEVTLEYATAQKTSAADAAHLLGRAIEDPLRSLRALRDVGVVLNQGQKDLIQNFIDTGNVAGRAKIVLDELQNSLGGGAAGENVGLYGATRSVSKAWEEFLITLGKSGAGKAAAEGINFITQALKDLDSDIEQFKGADTLDKKALAFARSLSLFEKDRKRLLIPEVVEPTSAAERAASQAEAAKAEEGPRKQAALRNAETARLAAYQALQARAAAAAAGIQKVLQIEQLGAAEQQALLQSSYDRGLVSIQQYYDARSAISQHAADVELQQIAIAIKAQQNLLKSPSTSKAAQPAIQGEIGRLQAQAELVRTRTAVAARESADKQIDAEQAFRDSIAQTTVALLEQQGHFEAASRLRISTEERVRELQLQSNKSPAALADLRRLEAAQIAQAKLNDSTFEYNVIREQEAARELDIQSKLAEAGADPKNQLNALAAINASRLASLPVLETITRNAIEQAKALGNQETVANLERQAAELRNIRAQITGAAAAAQAFQIAQQRATLLFRQESIEEQRVQNLRTAGSISALDTEILLDRAREDSLANLRKEADALEMIAKQTKDPEMIQRVEEMRVAIEGLEAAAHSAANIFQGIFQDSFSNAFVDFLQGTRTATAAFQDFVKSVIKGLEQIAAQQLAQAIFGSIFGAAGGAVGAGFTGLFGGAGTSVAISNRMAVGGITSGPTLAGEVPGQREAVIPLSGNRYVPVKLLNDGGGGTGDVNVQVNVTSSGQSSVQSSSRDGEELGRVIAAAVQSEMIRQKRPGGISFAGA